MSLIMSQGLKANHGQLHRRATITGCLLKYESMAFNPRCGEPTLVTLPLLRATVVKNLGYRQFVDVCRLWAVVRSLSASG
jgi:hypothetical protein